MNPFILENAFRFKVDGQFVLWILPRQQMSREDFIAFAPQRSIALDGMVSGGPFLDFERKLVNFDHHDNVVREATMSTCMQVYMAIKGGLMEMFGDKEVNIFINDIDQDASLAVWLLLNRKKFEGVKSYYHVNRLITLTDHWDITGGAYPVDLTDAIIREYAWVFRPYTEVRTSGSLGQAKAEELHNTLRILFARLESYFNGRAEKVRLSTDYRVLYQDPHFWITEELGGNESRYAAWAAGMKAFIGIVARLPCGKMVCAIGRRSRYIPFPIMDLYRDLNAAEHLQPGEGWGGSDIIGGSPRLYGTSLGWEQIRDITLERLAKAVTT